MEAAFDVLLNNARLFYSLMVELVFIVPFEYERGRTFSLPVFPHLPARGHWAVYFIKQSNAFNPFLIDFVPPWAFGIGRLVL